MLFASIMELIKRILKVNAKLENFKKEAQEETRKEAEIIANGEIK